MKKVWIPVLAGMTLWVAIATADDALEIGKTYYWVRNREPITIVERTNDGPGWYVIQGQGGEKKELRTWILEEAFKNGELVSELPPPAPPRSKITYSPSDPQAWEEPEGFKGLKWGDSVKELDTLFPENEAGNFPNEIERSHRTAHRGWSVTKKKIDLGGGIVLRRAEFHFLDNNFAGVTLYAGSWSLLVLAFTERYGKPHSIREVTFQNKLGAKFVGQILSWQGKNVAIELHEFDGGAASLKEEIDRLSLLPSEKKLADIEKRFFEMRAAVVGGVHSMASILTKDWRDYLTDELKQKTKGATKDW